MSEEPAANFALLERVLNDPAYGIAKCGHMASLTLTSGWQCRVGCKRWDRLVADAGGTPYDQGAAASALADSTDHGTKEGWETHKAKGTRVCEDCRKWRIRDNVRASRARGGEKQQKAAVAVKVRERALRILGRRHQHELRDIIKAIEKGEIS